QAADPDRLELGVLLQGLEAVLAAEAALLGAPERQLVVAVVELVDPGDAGLQLAGGPGDGRGVTGARAARGRTPPRWPGASPPGRRPPPPAGRSAPARRPPRRRRPPWPRGRRRP